MGAVEDTANRLGIKLDDTTKDVLNTCESVGDTVGKFIGYYEAAKKVLEFLGWGEQKDQLQELSTQVSDLQKVVVAGIKQLMNAIQVEGLSRKLDDFREIRGLAKAQRDEVANYTVGGGDLTDERGTIKNNSQNAVTIAGDQELWLRPFYESVYSGVGDPSLFPTTSRGALNSLMPPLVEMLGYQFIWEYRYFLPAYLEIINIRILVLMALEADSWVRVHKTEFMNLAKNLRQIHDSLLDSVIKLRRPGLDDLKHLYTYTCGDHPPADSEFRYEFFPSWWGNGLPRNVVERPYGVVELRAPKDYVHIYPDRPPDLPRPEGCPFDPKDLTYLSSYGNSWSYVSGDGHKIIEEYTETIQNEYIPQLKLFCVYFAPKHAMRTMVRWQEFCDSLGLPSVWDFMNQLRAFAGEAPLQGFISEKLNCWSVREVDLVVGLALKTAFEGQTSYMNARDEMAMAISQKASTAEPGQPISIRRLAKVLGTGGAASISLRQMFQESS